MDPKVVVQQLVNRFGTSPATPNSEEWELLLYISSLLTSNLVSVEEYETLGISESAAEGWDECCDFGDADPLMPSTSSCNTEQESPDWEPSPEKNPAGEAIPREYKERAYDYWVNDPKTGNPRTKRLSISTVQSKFRLIRSLDVLKKYAHRRDKPTFEDLNLAVYQRFCEGVERCAIIHDRTIRAWGLQLKRLIDPENTLNFKATSSWVYKFKKRFNVVSRVITHKVTKNWRAREAGLEEASNDFVANIRSLIANHGIAANQVLNADQSRFEKELHSYRTHRTQGIKKIAMAVGSVSATSHSYMIMPVVTMNGEILRPMYVLVAEPNGVFPASKPADPPNIKSFAGKSANMNKQDLKNFYSQAFWPSIPSDRKKILLLLDSWAANKDDNLSSALKPADIVLEKQLIPGGCTGKIQPLDVHFFRQYKSFVRYITDSAVEDEENTVWRRDWFLAIQSFAIYQFSAPRFRNMIIYAFYKCGYLSERPSEWDSPHKYCFEFSMSDCARCEDPAFVRCAHCDACFCLDHGIFKELHIDCVMEVD